MDYTAIGVQHDRQGAALFVVFWDYDVEEDYYYSWSSSFTLGM